MTTDQPDADVVVAVEGLHKRFGRLEVLNGIDLAVARRDVIALIGASGSGKSTLLRCLNGLEGIDAGRVRVLGHDLDDPAVDMNVIRQHIGIVFQSFNLFPHLRVIDNITLGPRKAKRTPSDQARAQALDLLERFGLAEKAHDFPDRLSGGQQQRVAIIRALAMEPDIMLFDEVTSALDPELVGEVLATVAELARSGITMLLATHEMGFARDVADRVCFLKGGVIVEQGSPQQMFTDPSHEDTKQ